VEKIVLCKISIYEKVRTMRLFHGTKSTDPKEINPRKEEGFDMSFSLDG
jgi:hypothetical protein